MIEATLYFRYEIYGEIEGETENFGAPVSIQQDGFFDSKVAVDTIIATVDPCTSLIYRYVRVWDGHGWAEFAVEPADKVGGMRVINLRAFQSLYKALEGYTFRGMLDSTLTTKVEFKTGIQEVRSEIAPVRTELHKSLRIQTITMVTAMVAIVGAFKLFG